MRIWCAFWILSRRFHWPKFSNTDDSVLRSLGLENRATIDWVLRSLGLENRATIDRVLRSLGLENRATMFLRSFEHLVELIATEEQGCGSTVGTMVRVLVMITLFQQRSDLFGV